MEFEDRILNIYAITLVIREQMFLSKLRTKSSVELQFQLDGPQDYHWPPNLNVQRPGQNTHTCPQLWLAVKIDVFRIICAPVRLHRLFQIF